MNEHEREELARLLARQREEREQEEKQPGERERRAREVANLPQQQGEREAISYGRFSTLAQEEGDSTRRQAESYRRICERYKDRCHPSARFTFGHFFGKGESGFSGEMLADGGSLAALITALESGDINPHKTVIAIEEFDRLGRLEPDLATGLLSRIVRSGCALAVDRPDIWIGSPADLNSPLWWQIQAMLVMAHEQSKQKSSRGKVNWARKRNNASEKPLTKMLPYWLKLERGKIVEIPERANLVRRMFELSADGLGRNAIAGIFNREKVPGFDKPTWNGDYIGRILKDKRVIGEYQPHVKINKKRIPHGSPVQGYYPETVPLDLWYRSFNKQASRKNKDVGRPTQNTNILSGLFKDATFNCSYVIHNKGNYKYFISAACIDGRAEFLALPLVEFEEAFLSYLSELDPSSLTMKAPSDLPARMEAAQGELTEALEAIKGLSARLQKKYSEVLADNLEQAEERKKAAIAKLESLEGEKTEEGTDNLASTKDLITLVRENKNDPIFRERLHSKLTLLIDKVWTRLVSDGGYHRRAYCQIQFRNGAEKIMQVDMIRKGKGGRKITVEVQTIADSHKKGIYLPNPERQ